SKTKAEGDEATGAASSPSVFLRTPGNQQFNSARFSKTRHAEVRRAAQQHLPHLVSLLASGAETVSTSKQESCCPNISGKSACPDALTENTIGWNKSVEASQPDSALLRLRQRESQCRTPNSKRTNQQAGV